MRPHKKISDKVFFNHSWAVRRLALSVSCGNVVLLLLLCMFLCLVDIVGQRGCVHWTTAMSVQQITTAALPLLLLFLRKKLNNKTKKLG